MFKKYLAFGLLGLAMVCAQASAPSSATLNGRLLISCPDDTLAFVLSSALMAPQSTTMTLKRVTSGGEQFIVACMPRAAFETKNGKVAPAREALTAREKAGAPQVASGHLSEDIHVGMQCTQDSQPVVLVSHGFEGARLGSIMLKRTPEQDKKRLVAACLPRAADGSGAASTAFPVAVHPVHERAPRFQPSRPCGRSCAYQLTREKV
ncbi:MAG: hypothetical protein V4582_15690 [Pseudomonadota bacterium]